MSRVFYPVVFLALELILLSMGCSKSRAAGENVRIGIITSLSGSQAAFGYAHRNGYTIALNEINANGGILGKKVEPVYYDDHSKRDDAVQGVSKLVDHDHVPIILGAYSSESTQAIVPVVSQKQIPLLIPTAVADNVMETRSQWVFRLCAGSGAFATATLDFLKHNGAKTLAIIYENTDFGRANDKSMTEAASRADLHLVDSEMYNASSPDYSALLQHVKSTHPDAIYFASYLLDAATLMRQAKQANLNPRFYTSAGTGFAAAEFLTRDRGAGEYAEYTFSVSQWLPAAHWKGSADFDQKYFQLTGTHPSYHAMEAYAALLVAADAINAANSIQPTSIRDAIRSLDLPQTPFGPVKFDAEGQNAHPVLLTQVLGGRYRVVWPPGAAETKPIVPTPPWSKR